MADYIIPVLNEDGTFESTEVNEAIGTTVAAQISDPGFQEAIKGDTGPVPTLASGETTDAPASTPPSLDLVKVDETTYRVNATIPRGLPGLDAMPQAEGMAEHISTPGPVQTALNAQSVQTAREVSGRVDARYYGLPTDGSDAAPALNAAANAARVKGWELFIPDVGTLYIDSHVNWRHIKQVECQPNIVMRHTDDIGVTIGWRATQRPGCVINIRSVKHDGAANTDWDFSYPAIRVIGLKGSKVNIPNCTLLELYAVAGSADDDSTAYNTFHIQRVHHVRFWGDGGIAWCNQNKFIGGSVRRVTMGGSYSHNDNKFEGTNFEGSESLVDIQRGSTNVFENVRAENNASIQFGENTHNNQVSVLYQSNEAAIRQRFNIVEDKGVNNIVTTVSGASLRAHTVLAIDRNSLTFDTATTLPGSVRRPTPSVGMGKLLSTGTAHVVFDTGIFPVESPRVASASYAESSTPRSRINRIDFSCDQPILRPVVYGYDLNGNLIRPDAVPFLSTTAVPLKINSTGDGYNVGAGTAGAPIIITNDSVKYLRIVLSTPSSSTLFDHITLTAYADSSVTDGVIERIRAAIRRPLYGTAVPTQGLAWPGTIVQGPSGAWKAVARAETTLASTAAADSTGITVSSGTGITTGDVIGILQSDGVTHWTTVASISGATVGLTNGVPIRAVAGAEVGTTRWATT